MQFSIRSLVAATMAVAVVLWVLFYAPSGVRYFAALAFAILAAAGLMVFALYAILVGFFGLGPHPWE